MRIIKDIALSDFEFWCGALGTAKYLTEEELDTIDFLLEDLHPEGLTDTEINDIFWFEDDFIAECLGYESFEKLMKERENVQK